MAPIHAHKVHGAIDRNTAAASVSVRKFVNAPFDISPDAIANSRCFIRPRPTTFAHTHIVGWIEKRHVGAFATHQSGKVTGFRASPHSNRWFPSCQRSPGRVTAGSG